jgi:hypothetical protein
MPKAEHNNQIQVIVFFAIILIVLILVGVVAVRPPMAGDGFEGVDGNNTTAILVVDAFEPLPGFIPPRLEDQSDKNCIIDPTGQGGWISGAGGWISGAGGWISGAGGWISGAGGWISGAAQQPILDPHGRLVYNEMEALVRTGGGILTEFYIGSKLADTTTPNTDWLRDVGRWNMGADQGDILLAALDTDEYTSEVMADRIRETVELFNRRFGVTRFVVNMSFAIVPCDDVLTPGDYQEFLDEEAPEFRAEFEAAMDALVATVGGAPLPESVAEFLDTPEAEQFRQQLVQAQGEQFDPCYPVRDGLSTPNDSSPTNQATQPDNRQQNGLPADAICSEVQPENDPLAQSLLKLKNTELQGIPLSIIPIAASGNRGDTYSFAPGFWPEVVSVSAFYDTPEFCAGFPLPPSNAGEVQMYGMYDCLPGTSFAAPRLSLEAGVYLLRDGTVSCAGLEAESSPPLSYLHGQDGSGNPTFEYLFNNLNRVDASIAYCNDFNAKVGIPATPTP